MKARKILAVIITVAMLFSMMSFTVSAETATETLVISADYTLDSVNIEAAEGPAIAIAENADVTLTVVGDNYVKGAIGFAGVYVPVGSKLTIVGDGTLTAVGGESLCIKYKDLTGINTTPVVNLYYIWSAGAGIGGNGAFYLRNRNYTEWGTAGSDGIHYKKIYDYLVKNTADFGTVIIEMGENGVVNATGGASSEGNVGPQGSGAGIGSGGTDSNAYYNVNNPDENLRYTGNITIKSGNVTANGGMGENTNSTNSGAGIGAGCSSSGAVGNNININIEGGTIVAIGNGDSAGIGGGAAGDAGNITISGGNITAVSGVETTESGNGAGIGAGNMASGGMVTINGDAVVSATANGDAAGIGAGAAVRYGAGADPSIDLHNPNVIFGGTADITFAGNKTTFFKVEEGATPTLKAEGAVCEIVDSNGTAIGFATSLEEAASVIDEFDDVDTLKLVSDVEVAKTVVVEDNITIVGNGYTIKGKDVEDPTAWDDTAVTPLKITNNAVVTLEDVTVKGGSVVNNSQYQPEASYGIAGDAIIVDGATLIANNSKILGGNSESAEFTNSAGSAIEIADATIKVNDSYLANGRISRMAISVPVINTDEESYIELTNTTLDSAQSSYGSAAIISSFSDGNEVERNDPENPVYMNGRITILGNKLREVAIAVPDGGELSFSGNVSAEYIADVLKVEFVSVAQDDETDEVSDLYDIVIAGYNDEAVKNINRLSTADFYFDFTGTPATENGAMDYEIIPVDGVTVTPDYNVENRYMFNFDGITSPDKSAKRITIGQVKINGYGEYSIALNENEYNLVTTAKTNDNIVDYFYVGGDTAGDKELDLGDGNNATIEIPTRDLTIKVDFPNNIVAREFGYQNMRVIVEGPENYKKTIELGDGFEGTENINKNDCYYEFAIEDELTLNSAYTVTVEGVGYRTAKYTVSMTENKTLNFWNNVKDNDTYIEVSESGVKKNAVKTNFLAGDIVKDNNINVYDLSAVVSYFGEINLDKDNKPQYAKYDLNRDGKVDSKDVAYVLVSWGN